MVWCSHCADDCDTQRDLDKGYVCCAVCGKVIDHEVYFSGPSFEKSSKGQSRLSGSILHSAASAYSLSRQKTLDKGRLAISEIVSHLNVGGGESIITRAHNLYIIAVERNFTKGRRSTHVLAACLYIVCRQCEKTYLLIDFSNYLGISVYVLGAVFLQLCKLLRLSDHPIVQKLVDPSLFIHRFTESLLNEKNNNVPKGASAVNKNVSKVALRIVASMKRDWMQTGRKPSGLCGAALYISALSHGFNYSKSDVVNVVHICEATLSKRLIEFENTESGSLTIDEFMSRANEVDDVSQSYQSPVPGEVLCEHKDTDEPHFAHGLCRQCFNEFIKLSGGLNGGAEPPAFQHAERQRLKKLKTAEKDMEQADLLSKPGSNSTLCAAPAPKELYIDGHSAVSNSVCNESEKDFYEEETRDPENFSDIDDIEVDGYLHNEEEKQFKKIIWEEMNKEYLEEQAAKEAAAAAKVALDAAFATNYEEFCSAQELAAATAEALANSRKEKRQKRAEERRNAAPAKSPLEATCQLLKQKSFSQKINYKALESMYTANAKKQGTEDDAGESGSGEKAFEEEELDEDLAADGGDDIEGRASVGDDQENIYDNADGDYGTADDYYGDEDDYYGGDDYGNADDYYED